jgi:hypothetical protein
MERGIENAFHAVAIDERTKVFNVTPMEKNLEAATQQLRQVWFPGTHGCVGGRTAAWQGLTGFLQTPAIPELLKLSLI